MEITIVAADNDIITVENFRLNLYATAGSTTKNCAIIRFANSPIIAVCEKGRLIANEVKTTISPPSGPMMYAARSIIANEKSSFKNDTGGKTGKSSRDTPNATAAKTAVKAILLAVK